METRWRDAIFDVIQRNQHHTFIILTKRPENISIGRSWYPNIWLGVTAENQEQYESRWRSMWCRMTKPTSPDVLFISVEPMLGPINLVKGCEPDWVIAGPENGPKARPCHESWIHELSVQSKCFFDKRDKWIRREFPR